MSECKNKGTSECMNECMHARMDECMNKCVSSGRAVVLEGGARLAARAAEAAAVLCDRQ